MPLRVSSITPEHLKVSIEWIAKMSESDKWDLADEEVANLLSIDTATYQNVQRLASEDKPFAMTHDTIERLSLLLGIWKALQQIVPADRKDLAFIWFNKPSSGSMFMGRSIKEYLLEEKTIDAMFEVKKYLDCENWETYFESAGASTDFMSEREQPTVQKRDPF